MEELKMGLIGFNYPAYEIALLSHQTGLSAVNATANVYVNIGTSFTIPKTGIMKMSLIGHVAAAADDGLIAFNLTRGSSTYQSNHSYIVLSEFMNTYNGNITNTTPQILQHAISNAAAIVELKNTLEFPVLANDSVQMICTTSSTNGTVYIDDVLVLLQ